MSTPAPKRIALALVALLLSVALFQTVELSEHLARHPAYGNVLAEAEVEATGSAGIARHALRGPLAPDGIEGRTGTRAVALGNRGGSLELDLGEVTPLAALLVQAHDDDALAIEGSLDGLVWQRLRDVQHEPGNGRLLTRRYDLEPTVRVRHLRIRNLQSNGFALLAAVRAWSTPPPGWPDRIEESAESSSPSLLHTRLDYAQIQSVKLAVAWIGAGLLVLLYWLDRRQTAPRIARLARFSLIGMASLALLGSWNLLQVSERDYALDSRNPVDVYVYWMGAKYLENLGYDNLYHCTVVADDEVGLGAVHLKFPRMRELRTNGLEPRLQNMTNRDRCKQRFTPERWSEFQRDLDWFRQNTRLERWFWAVTDHGFNGSPAFAILGSVARLQPVSDGWISFLTFLDVFLYVAMWTAAWSTFGWRATCAALLFWGTNFVAGNWFTIGTFLRGDWLALSVLGVCALARQRFTLGGLLLMAATLLRLFPGFLLGGIALAGLVEMIRRRTLRIPADTARVAVGAIAAVLLMVPLSIAATGSASTWKAFAANSLKHKQSGDSQDLSVDVALSYFDSSHRPAEPRSQAPVATIDHPVRKGVVALLSLFVLGLATLREKPWVCAILGTAWLPFVAGMSNYYYAFVLLFGLLLARRPDLVFLFAPLIALAAAPGIRFHYLDLDLYPLGSALFVAFLGAVLLRFAWDGIRSDREQPAGHPPRRDGNVPV
jgi:hypothetical protein